MRPNRNRKRRPPQRDLYWANGKGNPPEEARYALVANDIVARQEARDLRAEILGALHDVNEDLLSSYLAIEAAGIPCTRIKLVASPLDVVQSPVNALKSLPNWKAQGKTTRVIVDLRGKVPPDWHFAADAGASHILYITRSDDCDPGLYHSPIDTTVARVNLASCNGENAADDIVQGLKRIIHDVIVEIAVSHGMGMTVEAYGGASQFKLGKWAYVQGRYTQIRPWNLSVHGNETRYIPFSSLLGGITTALQRDRAVQLVKEWSDLKRHLAPTLPADIDGMLPKLRAYPFIGSIGKKALHAKLIEARRRSPSEAIFLFCASSARPANREVRQTLATQFGRKRWRAHMFGVYSRDEYLAKFQGLAQYVWPLLVPVQHNQDDRQ